MSRLPSLRFESSSQSSHVHSLLKSSLTSFNRPTGQNYLRRNKGFIKPKKGNHASESAYVAYLSNSHRCDTASKNNEKPCKVLFLCDLHEAKRKSLGQWGRGIVVVVRGVWGIAWRSLFVFSTRGK
jgi:hypothetical protein